MTRKCNCWKEPNTYCRNPLFIILRVKVFHPDSLRHSWQTWYLCKEHYNIFREVNGEGWGCYYRNNKKPFAPLTEFKIF